MIRNQRIKIKKLRPGEHQVSGSINIYEFVQVFEVNPDLLKTDGDDHLPDTLGGWITHRLGNLPQIRQKVDLGPLTLIVKETQERRVTEVLVKSKLKDPQK